MRMSESLQKNVLEVGVGILLNKFKGKSRRDTFFFEDILAEYVFDCQSKGYNQEMRCVGQEWMSRVIQELIPNTITKLPPDLFFNLIMRKIWINLGLMDDLNVVSKNNLFEFEIKNEGLTRLVGKNELAVGLYMGVLNALFERQVECKSVSQTRELCKYSFLILKEPFEIKSKTKEDYLKLNHISPINGFTLKDALREGIFQLNSNRVCFRGKDIGPIENTVFHIIGHRGILLENVSTISRNYFKQIIEKDASYEKKLVLLKTLLQVMGWGIVNITIEDKDKITIDIKSPPYGLLVEEDNWDFLIQTILGYLQNINPNFRLSSVQQEYEKISTSFSLTTPAKHGRAIIKSRVPV